MITKGTNKNHLHADSAYRSELWRIIFGHRFHDPLESHRSLTSTLLLSSAVAFLSGCAQALTPETLAPELPPPTEYATPSQIAEWESTLLARSGSSCRHIVWQVKGETLSDAVSIYERDYLPGDCLALEPAGTTVDGVPYGAIYIGFGGTFDSDLPPDRWTCGQNWPGHCLTYLSDTPIATVFPSTTAQSKARN